MEGDGGPRIWALGPPRDRTALRSNERSGEHFELGAATPRNSLHHSQKARIAAVQAALRGRDAALGDEVRPFARGVGVELERAPGSEFFRRHYGLGEDPEGSAEGDGGAWRRIDQAWLAELDELALQYDNYVNNTSLVLAISPPHSDKVLLFVGDAQAGNWLSWCDEQIVSDDGAGSTVTSHDLLERTVLYKVGHHGSHNATLRKGLEKMTAGELRAIVPTDEEWAWRTKTSGDGGWRMPFLPIYRALLEHCQGRVLQTDTGLPTEKPRMAPRASDGKVPFDDAEWAESAALIAQHAVEIEAWRGDLVVTDLFFEFELGE
jgi:hypothetical protein